MSFPGVQACLTHAVSSVARAGGGSGAPGVRLRAEYVRHAAEAGGAGEEAGAGAAAEGAGNVTVPYCPRTASVPGSPAAVCPPRPPLSGPCLLPPTSHTPAGAAAGPHCPAGQGDREGAGPAAAAAKGALRDHHPAAPVLYRPGDTTWEAGHQGRGIRERDRTHSRPAQASERLLGPWPSLLGTLPSTGTGGIFSCGDEVSAT